MSAKSGQIADYRFMVILALTVGLLGIAFQFMPGWESLTFMLTVAVLGGLIAGENGYEEQARQQLKGSYRVAFEWLLLFMMAAFALIELSKWLPIPEETIQTLNNHWPGLVIATMCALIGMAGLQKKNPGEHSA